MNLKIISAGAGSGKTFRLTTEMVSLLASGQVRASGIIATTFTKKAAAELQERVRVRLLEEGLANEANDLANALIGTVHGLGVKLLRRFSFEAGVSPQVDIIADEDHQVMFNQSLATVLTIEKVAEMERLALRLGLQKSDRYKTDWRRILKDLTEIARANDFSEADLEKSKESSWQSFQAFLDETHDRSAQEWNDELARQIEASIASLENSGDSTKVTAEGIKTLKELLLELEMREELFWYNWVKISKLKVGAKSKEHLEPLITFSNNHLAHASFHEDVKSFIFNIFELASAAMQEYGCYKESRGLIDYTDMEVLVKRLLDHPLVQEVLSEELDLLMVDEFQDTSPIQLEIFLKLSRFAKNAIWVGDPKQSIYGFRGAEPALMEAVIKHAGGLKKENILEYSWRSREDIVLAANAIFTKAFSNMPVEQVALKPKRLKDAEPAGNGMSDALGHWHFKYDGEGRAPGKEWLNNCVAATLEQKLASGIVILPKGEKAPRIAMPGDVAILCRSNKDCQEMAEALHRTGLRAAISRTGLLATAEAKLVLACLKFILNKYDSLSIAEILLLGGNMNTEEIIDDRLVFLNQHESGAAVSKWGEQHPFIHRLNLLRMQVAELSGTEILTLLLEELELKRIIVSWGNIQQRLSNIDMLCSLAAKYEDACNRLHAAASLGGLLLWLSDLENNGLDTQGSAEDANAVNVLTYHRSKGLEYPITICLNLENALREEVWGLSLVSEQAEVDLEHLLSGRWLRFWVNPYADLVKNTVLDERISESDVKADKRREALDEEARLLYVGITRARDYLVFPTRMNPTLWLNRVCHGGQEERPALTADSDDSGWEWDGQLLRFDSQSFIFPKDVGSRELSVGPVQYWDERTGKKDFPKYLVPIEKNGSTGKLVIEEEMIAPPLSFPEIPERKAIVNAVRSFLLANSSKYPQHEQALMANELIARNEVTELAEGQLFLASYSAFDEWVTRRYPYATIYKKFPVHVVNNGTEFHATLDMLVHQKEGYTIIMFSDFVGKQKHLSKKALEWEAFIYHCIQTVGQINAPAMVDAWVYFINNGVAFHFQPVQNKKGQVT